MVIGVDPGITGGVVALSDDGKILEKYTMPSVAGLIDIAAFADLFREFTKGYAVHVFMEQAQSFPKQGVASSFNYGRGFGNLEGVLGALRIARTLVRPHVWTKVIHAGLQKELPAKEKSKLALTRLFPDVDLRASERCRKQHEGMMDALLIAEYGRRTLAGH